MNGFAITVRVFEELAAVWMWAAIVYCSLRGGIKPRRMDNAIAMSLLVVCLVLLLGEKLSWWPRDVTRLAFAFSMAYLGFAYYRNWKRDSPLREQQRI
jgi:hypothetical protein